MLFGAQEIFIFIINVENSCCIIFLWLPWYFSVTFFSPGFINEWKAQKNSIYLKYEHTLHIYTYAVYVYIYVYIYIYILIFYWNKSLPWPYIYIYIYIYTVYIYIYIFFFFFFFFLSNWSKSLYLGHFDQFLVSLKKLCICIKKKISHNLTDLLTFKFFNFNFFTSTLSFTCTYSNIVSHI